MKHLWPVIEALERGSAIPKVSGVNVYERSQAEHGGVHLLMVKDGSEKRLLAAGKGELYDDLEGKELAANGKVCPLSHHNRLVLNRYFDYTAPKAFGPEVATIGLGDRLGLASPGHIESVRDKDIKPILAQQSVRELELTNRTFEDVLDASCFAVFQEGYKGGFGADGDHLKDEVHIQLSLDLGMSMLTLDCSDHIRNEIEAASDADVREQYGQLSQDVKDRYKELYLQQPININGLSLTYDESSLMKNALIYREAIAYMIHIYNAYIRKQDRPIDFEISIDETEMATTPLAHYFVANELQQAAVEMVSLAPAFAANFKKELTTSGISTSSNANCVNMPLLLTILAIS